MNILGRKQRRYFGGIKPTIVRTTSLGVTQIECRQGVNAYGCQKELAIPQQVTVGTTPTLIKTNNPYRDAIIITNTSPATPVFIGPYYVSLTNGQEIPGGQSFTFPSTSELWGIAASSLVVTFAEVGRE